MISFIHVEGEIGLEAYITSKARDLVARTADGRRPSNLFIELADQEITSVDHVMQQISIGAGFSAEKPVVDVGTTAMHLAIAILGLHSDQVRSKNIKEAFLDEHVCRHPLTGRQVSLFNRVADQPTRNNQ